MVNKLVQIESRIEQWIRIVYLTQFTHNCSIESNCGLEIC